VVGEGEVTDAGFEGGGSTSSRSMLEEKKRFVPSLFTRCVLSLNYYMSSLPLLSIVGFSLPLVAILYLLFALSLLPIALSFLFFFCTILLNRYDIYYF